MTTDIADQIRTLINRLARLDAADRRADDLNPAQIAALEYLSRANRFSRAPSHVAAYLGTTRGTMSQTLKALERKGHVRESRSASDRRSIAYALTASGSAAIARANALADAIGARAPADLRQLRDSLADLLAARLRADGMRSFGLCRTCAHHRQRGDGAFCALLSLPLAPAETGQICHEHVPA